MKPLNAQRAVMLMWLMPVMIFVWSQSHAADAAILTAGAITAAELGVLVTVSRAPSRLRLIIGTACSGGFVVFIVQHLYATLTHAWPSGDLVVTAPIAGMLWGAVTGKISADFFLGGAASPSPVVERRQ